MSLPHIFASEAKMLLDDGALLIDIREHQRTCRRKHPRCQNHPLSTDRSARLSEPLR